MGPLQPSTSFAVFLSYLAVLVSLDCSKKNAAHPIGAPAIAFETWHCATADPVNTTIIWGETIVRNQRKSIEGEENHDALSA